MALWLVGCTETFREPPSKSGWVSLQTATKRASQASRRPWPGRASGGDHKPGGCKRVEQGCDWWLLPSTAPRLARSSLLFSSNSQTLSHVAVLSEASIMRHGSCLMTWMRPWTFETIAICPKAEDSGTISSRPANRDQHEAVGPQDASLGSDMFNRRPSHIIIKSSRGARRSNVAFTSC